MKVGSQIAECSLSFVIRYKITFFKKGVTTRNIVCTLYREYTKGYWVFKESNKNI